MLQGRQCWLLEVRETSQALETTKHSCEDLGYQGVAWSPWSVVANCVSWTCCWLPIVHLSLFDLTLKLIWVSFPLYLWTPWLILPILQIQGYLSAFYSPNTHLGNSPPLATWRCAVLCCFQSDWPNVPLTAWAEGPFIRSSLSSDILLVCLGAGNQEWPHHSPSKFRGPFNEANLFTSLMLTVFSNMPHFTEGNISWSEAVVYKLRQE